MLSVVRMFADMGEVGVDYAGDVQMHRPQADVLDAHAYAEGGVAVAVADSTTNSNSNSNWTTHPSADVTTNSNSNSSPHPGHNLHIRTYHLAKTHTYISLY